ncbi:MAG TPA: hypothetical protein PLT32_01850 [bacterium]|nr:hypothetical protein [bacterium]
MHKFLAIFYLLLSVLTVHSVSADVQKNENESAADYFFSGAQEAGGPMGYNITTTQGEKLILDKITLIINIILGLLGIVFLGLAIYGGFLWMTAGGKIDQVKHSKDLLAQAVIGLVVVLLAYAITFFVVTKLL